MLPIRRNPQSGDGDTARFLYAVLRQLDTKSIDWDEVAEDVDQTNGHAARMRYSRFRAHMESLRDGNSDDGDEDEETQSAAKRLRAKKHQTKQTKAAGDKKRKTAPTTDVGNDKRAKRKSAMSATAAINANSEQDQTASSNSGTLESDGHDSAVDSAYEPSEPDLAEREHYVKPEPNSDDEVQSEAPMIHLPMTNMEIAPSADSTAYSTASPQEETPAGFDELLNFTFDDLLDDPDMLRLHEDYMQTSKALEEELAGFDGYYVASGQTYLEPEMFEQS